MFKTHTYYRAFTIVELLIVVVIISIVSVLTLVTFSGVSKKAVVASLQIDLIGNAKKLKLYYVQNNTYPTTLDANYCPSAPVVDTTSCLKFSSGNSVNYSFLTASTFSLLMANGSSAYKITESTVPTSTTAYTLTLVAGANGTVSGGGTYELNATPTITATANSGYQFSSWTGDTGCSGVASHTITITGNLACTASFSVMGLYAFTTNTFTPAGVSGRLGPTLAQIQSAYSSQPWASNTAYLNMVTQGYQEWTVPTTANYTMTIAGAFAGFKGVMTTSLTQGQVLQIVVGQMPSGGSTSWTGGGGSFVYNKTTSTLIGVAGGGGGHGGNNGVAPGVGTSSTSGTAGSGPTCWAGGAGGTGGGGGGYGGWAGGGGGGYTGNGGYYPYTGFENSYGFNFLTGQALGSLNGGGFGGGGGSGNGGGGGGGGYSGGGGGGNWCTGTDAGGTGGGGGSYTMSSWTSAINGGNVADGFVTITMN